MIVLAIGSYQAGEPVETSSPESEFTSAILKEERDLERRIVGLGRVRVSFPQRVSGALGAMIVRQPVSYDCSTLCEFRGLFIQAEPGYSGGQINAGYAVVFGEKGRNEHLLSKVYMAYGLKGAFLRTWNDADLVPSDQTLLGLEGDFTIIGINFSLGAFRQIGQDRQAEDWVVTGGIGWGF